MKKLLIANRGEIAVRIIRACREMGIGTVAVYSEVDRLAPHVLMADRSYPIGPAEAAKSYLNVDRLLEVAAESGADLLHPGYGFLAENAEFAERAKHIADRLNAIDGVTCDEPTGAFYCFPDVSAHYGRTLGGIEVTDSMTFARAAIESANVALVPGAPFGEDHCVRLSFATDMDTINKGLDRIEKLLA